jgi:molybdopterin-guanine dinucleotide biosynthesis protein B
MTLPARPGIVAVVGRSGSGKTTLLEKLIPVLRGRGFRIGTVKHVSHGFEMDREGKDSWRHRRAGADATLVLTHGAIAMIRDAHEPSLQEATAYLDGVDIIVVEGFKTAEVPKIEVFRTDGPHPSPLFMEGTVIEALVTDAGFHPGVPVFGLDDAEALADFIQERFIHRR